MTKQEIDRFESELQQQILEQARKLYFEAVINHGMKPRNLGPMKDPDGHAKIKGPCSSTMEIFIRVRGDKIADATIVTDGGMTLMTAGSMAAKMAIGSRITRALLISKDDILDELGGLPKESMHCALLASNTLHGALKDYLRTEDGCINE